MTESVIVPRVATARLLLREFRRSDFDAFAAALADPVAAQVGGVAIDRRLAWRTFATGIGTWALEGAGWWGVELVETGAMIGTVGAFFRETSPELEIGWTIYRPFWRQGFASEAAKAALTYAFERHQPARAIAHIAKHNLGSIGVSKKLGMRYDQDVPFYEETLGRYVVER